MSIKDLQNIIDEYRKSRIQSEAEVRSKWIVPLLDVLGYPSELRSEEFPIYGYSGGTKLGAKETDFLLFASKDFASHRQRTQANLEWVHNNSLLVVEAKKPGALSEDNGQAQFYNAWSRAVGYILTDGETLRGFYYNPLAADFEIIDSPVDDLASCEGLWSFSYDNILSIKEDSRSIYMNTYADEEYTLITSDEEIEIPEETLEYVRDALGKNAEGLSNIQQVAHFLNTTEFILNNKLRHDIPEFYFNFPRGGYPAKLYVDSNIFSAFDGEVTEYYWEDFDRLYFVNETVDIMVTYYKNELAGTSIEIHAFDDNVGVRIASLQDILTILSGTNLLIVPAHKDKKTIKIPTTKLCQTRKDLNALITTVEIWIESLNKLKALEEYYDIQFSLELIHGPEEIEKFYDDLDFVYKGTVMEENYSISGPLGALDDVVVIDEPEFLQEIPPEKRERRIIHGVTFETIRTYLLPCNVKAKRKHGEKYLTLPVCCECKVVK